jgi:hypothetical protein
VRVLHHHRQEADVSERVVIVTGSRNWADVDSVYQALDNACPDLVVNGGAAGADMIARQWAKDAGVKVRTFQANWLKFGRRAGPLRNGLMLRAYPQATVLAFPLDGPGTADCMRQARELGMRLIVVQEVP